MKKRIFFIIIFILVAISLYAAEPGDNATTALNNSDMLNKIQSEFTYSAKTWAEVIKKYALYLFVTLGVINFAVKIGFEAALEGIEFQKLLASVVKYFLIFGFFFWLLDNGPSFAGKILNSFIMMGNESVSGGGTQSFGVHNILDTAFSIFNKISETLSVRKPVHSMVMAILALAIFIVMALIAANFLVEVISAWVMVYAGFFVLAFGSADWTRDMAISYFKLVIATGLKLMTIILMVGISANILNTQVELVQKAGSVMVNDILVMFITSVILLVIITKVPDAVANLAHSAWGNMGMFNIASGLAAGATALKIAKAVSSGGVSGVAGAIAGYKGKDQHKSLFAHKLSNKIGHKFGDKAKQAKESVGQHFSSGGSGSSGGTGGSSGVAAGGEAASAAQPGTATTQAGTTSSAPISFSKSGEGSIGSSEGVSSPKASKVE